ncbi:hypothetical protein P22_2571 [Propionispora sp. 2/2-37]|uniref:nucleoside triphosphate pyrophosphohydrolase n=1 Tax=Propionispora sp. 2/2-37 TaxID=1677858 RepID=UPI0006BB6EDD|nr:nucleoside triphosphate pyrophosphohydrolase [Propionispora sp. 2/2-37]CUH96481.1 hypothetical protein P22_2571 [Propionispora sp. 2/2-37]
MGDITIIGLGPGPFGLLTVETLEKLKGAARVLLRTAKHPTVDELALRGIRFDSYDYLYEEKGSFAEVYEAIAADCLKKAENGEQVLYAVPGSPLVAEKTVTLIQENAKKEKIPVHILPGMSFLEVLYTRLRVDPINGVTILDAADISNLPPDGKTALVITQVYNRQVASETKLSLMESYDDDFLITVVRSLGLPDEEIAVIPLYELDRLQQIDHLTSVYVPAPAAPVQRFSIDPLVKVMATLRSPGGCVWDREQDHASLRRYLLEEVYEVLEAIELRDSGKLCEELGDLLLQIVFHARVAEECGHFAMQDVIDQVTTKLIRRHPHVFGDITVKDAAEVVLNWDAIKKEEKGHERKSVLDGVPIHFPALARAAKLQAKAGKVGFDWDNIAPVWEKLYEELAELQEAVKRGSQQAMESELGDILFATVNLARFLAIDAEIALNVTNNKFIKRFSYIEEQVAANKLQWDKLTLAELDSFWNDAKKREVGAAFTK